jgi:hypothetical protein
VGSLEWMWAPRATERRAACQPMLVLKCRSYCTALKHQPALMHLPLLSRACLYSGACAR